MCPPHQKPLPSMPQSQERQPDPIQVSPSECTGPHRIDHPWHLAQPLKLSLCSLFNLSLFSMASNWPPPDEKKEEKVK